MLRLLCIIALLATLSSKAEKNDIPTANGSTTPATTANGNTAPAPATYEYFSPKTKLVKERIESLPKNMNRLLLEFTESYRPTKEVKEAIQIYKFSAELGEGWGCEADKNKFDETFQKMKTFCASTAAMVTNFDKGFDTKVASLLSVVQEIDYMLRVISGKYAKDSDHFDWPGNDRPKLMRKLNGALTNGVYLFQSALSAANTMLKDCIQIQTYDILLLEINKASEALRNCTHSQ